MLGCISAGRLDDVWVSRQPTLAADMAELAALPPSCVADVSEPKELMITDLRVVEDARATGSGVWTFKHLMESMAPAAAQAPEMVRQMFSTWLSDPVQPSTVPHLDDLERRAVDMEALLCSTPGNNGVVSLATSTSFIGLGIGRVQ